MKKTLYILVSVVLVFALTSCSISNMHKDISDKHAKNVALDKYRLSLINGNFIDGFGPFHVVDKSGRFVLDIYDIAKAHYEEDGANASLIFAMKDDAKEKFSNATKTIADYRDDENYMAVYLKGSLLGVCQVPSQMDLDELRIVVGASDILENEVDELNKIIRDIR